MPSQRGILESKVVSVTTCGWHFEPQFFSTVRGRGRAVKKPGTEVEGAQQPFNKILNINIGDSGSWIALVHSGPAPVTGTARRPQ
jgi:hypothetical protein